MTACLTFFVKTDDGLSLFVRDYVPGSPADELPVICLHGLTRNSADFEEVAPMIAETGRRVITMDMRGRGRSESDSNPANYRPDVYARDVIGVMNALNIPQAVFIGTSMGGIITMLVAVMAPGRFAASVLNDIGPELDPSGLARIMAYVGKGKPLPSWESMVTAIRETQSKAFPNADNGFWHVFARRVARELPDGRVEFAYDPKIALAFGTAPAKPAPSMAPMFKALASKPVLVIRGALSDLLSPEGVLGMRAIKPDLFTAEVPGVGHAPTLEEPTAQRALVEFLGRVGGPCSTR